MVCSHSVAFFLPTGSCSASNSSGKCTEQMKSPFARCLRADSILAMGVSRELLFCRIDGAIALKNRQSREEACQCGVDAWACADDINLVLVQRLEESP